MKNLGHSAAGKSLRPMSARPQRITQTELESIYTAARKAGMSMPRVEISKDGSVIIPMTRTTAWRISLHSENQGARSVHRPSGPFVVSRTQHPCAQVFPADVDCGMFGHEIAKKLGVRGAGSSRIP